MGTRADIRKALRNNPNIGYGYLARLFGVTKLQIHVVATALKRETEMAKALEQDKEEEKEYDKLVKLLEGAIQ